MRRVRVYLDRLTSFFKKIREDRCSPANLRSTSVMDSAIMNDVNDTIPLLRQGVAGDQSALVVLWDRYREILALRYFEELSNTETAEVLGIDPSAASSRHIRALKRLRQILKSIPGFFDANR